MVLDQASFFTIEACKALSIAFANAVDRRDYDRVLSVLTEDAEFIRWDRSFSGRDVIKSMLHSRDESIQTRHICSNIEIDNLTDTTATGITYFTFFNGEGEHEEVIPLAGPKFVGEYHDEFILIAGEWRIQKRKVRIVFGDIG
jgi:3-phenylpropionate/cinnamic acid dioxygenase small subunit